MADTTPAGAVATVVDSKSWYLSKTIWANVIACALAVAGILVNSPDLPPKLIAEITAIGIPVLNLVLRMLTDQAVTVLGK